MKKTILLIIMYSIIFCPSAFSQENGVHREYYESGEVQFERNYKNGQRDGVAKEYYEDGT